MNRMRPKVLRIFWYRLAQYWLPRAERWTTPRGGLHIAVGMAPCRLLLRVRHKAISSPKLGNHSPPFSGKSSTPLPDYTTWHVQWWSPFSGQNPVAMTKSHTELYLCRAGSEFMVCKCLKHLEHKSILLINLPKTGSIPLWAACSRISSCYLFDYVIGNIFIST